MSHPEKAILSCDLGNYRLLRVDYEDKNCVESRTTKKTIFIIGCMSRPEKAKSSCYLENIDFWDLIVNLNVAYNQKSTEKK